GLTLRTRGKNEPESRHHVQLRLSQHGSRTRTARQSPKLFNRFDRSLLRRRRSRRFLCKKMLLRSRPSVTVLTVTCRALADHRVAAVQRNSFTTILIDPSIYGLTDTTAPSANSTNPIGTASNGRRA